jgi:hypothetical protein
VAGAASHGTRRDAARADFSVENHCWLMITPGKHTKTCGALMKNMKIHYL